MNRRTRMNRTAALALPLVAALALTSTEAHARPSSKGIYTEAGIGAAAFVGRKHRYSQVGPAFDLRAGYDLFSWFSIGLHLGSSSHEALVPPPPQGEFFQLYTAHAEGRLGFLWRSLGVFVDGGAGFSMISTNVLEKVGVLDPGERYTFSMSAGGGLEYQLVNRHHAIGIAGRWTALPQFAATTFVTVAAYFRYTY